MNKYLIIVFINIFFLSCDSDSNEHCNFKNIDPKIVGVDNDHLKLIDELILQSALNKEVVGTNAIIVKNGGIVYHKAFGMADIDNNIKMTNSTIVAIASMSKLMTTVGALILFDRGLFNMDTQLDKILPEFENPNVFKSYNKKTKKFVTKKAKTPILMKHLFNHTSGIVYPIFIPDSLGREGYLNASVIDAFPDTLITLEENIKRLALLPLMNNPGERWWYGMNMDVLGRVIEVLDGRPFSKFMDEEIFIPLKLNNTGFGVSESKWNKVAKIYQNIDGEIVEFRCCPEFNDEELKKAGRKKESVKSYKYDPNVIAMGGADIYSTAYDYAKFLQMLLEGGALNDVTILGRKTVELINRPLENLFLPEDKGIAMGLSVGVVKDETKSYEHYSAGSYWWGGYFYTSYWVDPKEKLIGVIMSQMNPAKSELNNKFPQLVYSSLN